MIDENVKEEVKEQPKGKSTLLSDSFFNENCITSLPRHCFNLVSLPVRVPVNAMIYCGSKGIETTKYVVYSAKDGVYWVKDEAKNTWDILKEEERQALLAQSTTDSNDDKQPLD